MNANPLPEDWTSGLFARVPRTLVSVRGADRASFLHNLCTNDVRSLQTGQGCEAFFTNVQGKVLGHAFLFCLPETILIDTTEAQGGTLLPHLEKYHIREDVVLAEWDVTTVWLAGGNAWETVKPGDVRELPVLGCATWEWGGCSITGRCVPVTSPPSYFLSCVADQADALLSNLAECGLTESTQLLEELRIQAGFPTYGVDITAENLPQEVGRDQHAISFTKGCYLGQETVARIDALGHVNRCLVTLEFDDVVPPAAGEAVMHGEKTVGKVTSAVRTAPGRVLALAYVRRELVEAGEPVMTRQGAARIQAPD